MVASGSSGGSAAIPDPWLSPQLQRTQKQQERQLLTNQVSWLSGTSGHSRPRSSSSWGYDTIPLATDAPMILPALKLSHPRCGMTPAPSPPLPPPPLKMEPSTQETLDIAEVRDILVSQAPLIFLCLCV